MFAWDNYRRELIPQGQTGGLVIFEDHPNYWDAWGASRGAHMSASLVAHGPLFGSLDVEVHHLEKAQQIKFANVKIVAPGPLFASVESEVKFNKSTIKVTVSKRRDIFFRDGPSVNAIHIRSRWMRLKVCPVDISHATCSYTDY